MWEMNIKRTLKAVIISPLASTGTVVYMLGEDLLSQCPSSLASIASQVPGTLFVMALFSFGFVGMSYLIVVFIGLPAHWILSKLSIKHWGIYMIVGLVVGLALQFSVYLVSNMPAQLRGSGYLLCGINSVLVSIVFWRIAVKPYNNHRQGDAKMRACYKRYVFWRKL